MSVEVPGPELVILTSFDAAAGEGVGVVLDEWRVADLLIDWREAWLCDGERRRVEFIAGDADAVAGIPAAFEARPLRSGARGWNSNEWT